MAHCFLLNLSTNIPKTAPFQSNADRAFQCHFGNSEQLVDSFVDDPDGNSHRSVAYPSILDHADVEFYDVAILDSPLAADSVDDFVVNGNADVTGKNPMAESIAEERVFHAGFGHEISRRVVNFFRGNSRPN